MSREINSKGSVSLSRNTLPSSCVVTIRGLAPLAARKLPMMIPTSTSRERRTTASAATNFFGEVHSLGLRYMGPASMTANAMRMEMAPT
ncbi:MAG: hypothetical protein ACD_75C00821G0001 [uncultured bacterium]|nr:MAG: hypothetical protein ACD_75C00821G0001 [uncultured bacterium]